MKLVIMTKATFFVEEDKILTTLFEEGLDCLHLYKPYSEPVYSERLLTLLPEDYYKCITVHDHFYLREEFRLKGIHLDNAGDAVPAGYKGCVSRTCHDTEELCEARKHSNYVFLHPVFDDRNNPQDRQAFSYEQLKDAQKRGLINKKVYAMGGVCLDNIRQCRDWGFGGVVVCSDLWNHFDIHRELDYKELITHFKKLRKAAG